MKDKEGRERAFKGLSNESFLCLLPKIEKNSTLSWFAKFRSPPIPSPLISIVIASMISSKELIL